MKREFASFLIEVGRIPGSAISSKPDHDFSNREPLGRLALLSGALCGRDIEYILKEQEANGGMFGKVALRLGLLTPHQLSVLLVGQCLRACVELVEDLAMEQQIDMMQGVRAITEFLSSNRFANLVDIGDPVIV